MHEQILLLSALWREDQAVDAVLAASRALEDRVRRARAQAEEAEAALAEAKGTLDALQADEAARTRRMNDYAVHRDRAQRAIDTGTAPDYHVAAMQVERCAAVVDEEETAILGLMEQVEAAEARVLALTNARDAAGARLREASAERAARAPALGADLARATEARDAATEGIFPAELERYTRLRARGLAPFADVRAGACLGCNMAVNAIDLSEHRRGAAPVCCRHCGRFLGELL